MSSLHVSGAESIVTFPGDGPVRGGGMSSPIIGRGDLYCENGRFVPSSTARGTRIDATGCVVLPGFVDPHTHLPFYGWRADEDSARLSGIRYETLHAEEGGIFRSQRLLSEADDATVLGFGEARAGAMLRSGTTTFEMKSGYGLSVEAEMRQLRLAAELAARVPQMTTRTCLAAHAVPKNGSPGEWIGRAAEELLPAVADEKLASAVDIYVESIAFGLEHAARLAEAASQHGLQMRVHADQLADNQTASFAARWDFRSADHLNHTSPEGVGDLASSDTAAVLLPGATFTLRQKRKPFAEELVREGAIVALGSDLNPGTSPVSSMGFVMALACRLYGLRPIEALAAATVNAAYVLGVEKQVGRIADGYRADLIVLDAPSFEHLIYRPDADHIAAVVCGGDLAYVAPRAIERVEG